jgi:uncharacterized protein
MGRSCAVIAFGLMAGMAWAGTAWAECRSETLEVRGQGGVTRFSVEVADSNEERSQGLMFRESMPQSSGMLFVYDNPRRVSFWMQNTLIPLDMVFADQTGTVTRIHENAVPKDRTPIDGGTDVQFVLEINGGLARRLGIAEGSALRHPAIDQSVAAFPCLAE